MAFTESLKANVKRRAHFSCCLCHAVGVEVHHIVPQANGGQDVEDNAAPLCPSCHEIYGANPEKRKLIREARDLWYEICARRFASDSERLNEISEVVRGTASKADLEQATHKLEILIQDLGRRQEAKRDVENELSRLIPIVGTLNLVRKLYSADDFRRRARLTFAIIRLPKEVQGRYHKLLARTIKIQLNAVWMSELVNYAITGDLEKRIRAESSMSEGDFEEYLRRIVERDFEAAMREPDVWLDGLTIADAERIQAEQASPPLFEEWLATSESNRPFLVAQWISEGKVRRLNFKPGRDCEDPGFLLYA